jgi:hypothetical protein
MRSVSDHDADDLVKVAVAQNEAEADLIEALLRDAGIPAVVRRSRGADVPDFLASGARDVLVAASTAEIARDALSPEPREPATPPSPFVVSPLRLLAGLAVGCVLVALVVWLVTLIA